MSELEKIKVAFTDAEKLDLGERLADAHDKASNFDEASKEAAKERREQSEEMWRLVAAYAGALRMGWHEVEVDVTSVYNEDTGMVDVCRSDTGEVVRSRKPRPEERLTPLPFPEGPVGVPSRAKGGGE